MQIENWNINDVKPYENNPRKNDEAVEKVANSIKEFGWQQPIVVDANGVVIVGHTRLKAAQELGLDEVPVLVAKDLTDDQAKAYRLADNKTGELAIWDWAKLDLELQDIDWLDMNMEDFGFNLINPIFEDDLMIDKANQLDIDTFSISIVFPVEYKDKITEFIRENGKDEIADMVIKRINK